MTPSTVNDEGKSATAGNELLLVVPQLLSTSLPLFIPTPSKALFLEVSILKRHLTPSISFVYTSFDQSAFAVIEPATIAAADNSTTSFVFFSALFHCIALSVGFALLRLLSAFRDGR